MEVNMLFTLLGLCVGLCMGLEADTQNADLKDFNVDKFLGFWYEIAFASMVEPQALGHKEQMLGAMIAQLENNLLFLITTYYNDEHCALEKIGIIKTSHTGEFRIIRTSDNDAVSDLMENKEVTIMATDYMTYAIIDITSPVNGVAYRTMKLYSRSLDNNENAFIRFRTMALEKGFATSNIYFNKNDLTCVDKLKQEMM